MNENDANETHDTAFEAITTHNAFPAPKSGAGAAEAQMELHMELNTTIPARRKTRSKMR